MSETTHRGAAAARAAAQLADRSSLRSALQEERRGYVQRGNQSRIDQVDEQLDALGPDEATTPDEAEQDSTPEPPKRGRGSVKAAVAAEQSASEQS